MIFLKTLDNEVQSVYNTQCVSLSETVLDKTSINKQQVTSWFEKKFSVSTIALSKNRKRVYKPHRFEKLQFFEVTKWFVIVLFMFYLKKHFHWHELISCQFFIFQPFKLQCEGKKDKDDKSYSGFKIENLKKEKTYAYI